MLLLKYVVSKTYFINIANESQTALQLLARVTGNRSRMVKQSENPADYSATGAPGVGTLINGSTILPATYSWLDNSQANQSNNRATFRADDTDYNTVRKYDLTPIILTNPDVTASTQYEQTVSIPPFQSTQNKNQFIYSRYSDVSAEGDFYSYVNPASDYTFNLDTVENFYNAASNSGAGNPTTEFIWGGGFLPSGLPTTATSYPVNDDVVAVSIAHPYLVNYTAYREAYESFTGDTNTLPATVPAGGLDCSAGGNGTGSVLFRQSKFAPLKIDQPYGKQQAIYLNENVTDLYNLSTGSGGVSQLTVPFDSGQSLQASPSITTPALANLWDVSAAGYITGGYARNAKTSFEGFDQYTLGKQSCGSYLFISSDNHLNIQVDGDSIQSIEIVQFGQQNAISVPLVFQYRMTDYFGTVSGSGLGNVGGDSTGSTVNLTYAKRIGFDLLPNNSDVIQFDIEVSAKYRSDRLTLDVFPKATVTKGLNDLEKVVAGLRPSITQTTVSGGGGGGGRGRGSQTFIGTANL